MVLDIVIGAGGLGFISKPIESDVVLPTTSEVLGKDGGRAVQQLWGGAYEIQIPRLL